MNSEIKLGLRAGLAQQERSLLQLIVQVASLCEKHGAEVTREACRLLPTEAQPSQSDGYVGLDAEESGASPSQMTRRRNLGIDDGVGRDSDCANAVSDVASARSGASMTSPWLSLERMDCREFEGFVPPHVMKESHLKNLPFIDPVMGVDDPVPTLVYIIGPRGLPYYQAIMGKLQAWRPMENSFAQFAKSAAFQCLCSLVIVANFVVIAVKADRHATHTGQDGRDEFSALGHCFTAFYTLELAINLAVHGGTFWTCDDCGWNVLDCCIVLMSLIETVIATAGGDFVDASFLRVLRFARISRVLRMFSAVRMFKEIRIMVDALAGSLSIFVWCSALLVLLMALFAIFFVQGYSSFVETRPSGGGGRLKEYFGSVGAAMLSLFMCATGGTDWRVYYDETGKMGDFYKCLIVFFIGFYNFCFYNVITGVFCEKALALAKPTLEELLSERYQKEFNDARELYHLLSAHLARDDTKSTWHNIDAEQFEKFIDEPTVERFFEVRGLGPSSARRFFRMLCELNGTHHVDFPTFVSACIKLDGTASSIDLHVMSVRQLLGMYQMQTLQRHTHSELQTTRDETHHLAKLLTEKVATLQGDWREEFKNIATPEPIMPPMSSTIVENRSSADHTSSVSSVEAGELRPMLTAICSDMVELKSMQTQIQSMQSQIQRDLQPTLSENKERELRAESHQRALEGHQHALEALHQLVREQPEKEAGVALLTPQRTLQQLVREQTEKEAGVALLTPQRTSV